MLLFDRRHNSVVQAQTQHLRVQRAKAGIRSRQEGASNSLIHLLRNVRSLTQERMIGASGKELVVLALLRDQIVLMAHTRRCGPTTLSCRSIGHTTPRLGTRALKCTEVRTLDDGDLYRCTSGRRSEATVFNDVTQGCQLGPEILIRPMYRVSSDGSYLLIFYISGAARTL